MRSMYEQLQAHVCKEESLGPLFPVKVGTRQGCNLSPFLFNLYINDIPSFLQKGNCDPVHLSSTKINTLMYADDTLIMSRSEKGLMKALRIIEIFCKKWHLKINTDKTKIMIFNKDKVKQNSFCINDQVLEIVQNYNYLGLKINKSGNFTTAIKYLSNKAMRAYMALKSSLNGTHISPRLYLKLFDSLVKPIAIYGCEAWGGFGHKCIPNANNHGQFQKERSPYEQLHIKACKYILGVSKHSSNIGCKAELGRFPHFINIVSYVCKYRIRLQSFGNNDLLFHALESQKQIYHNSYKTLTYEDFSINMLHTLGLNKQNIPTLQINEIKHKIKNIFKPLQGRLSKLYISWFHSHLNELRLVDSTKLNLYCRVKKNYVYEKYLNCKQHKYITKFRLSDHWLPIERGRYQRPRLSREDRICTMCDTNIGTEKHALFDCSDPQLHNLKSHYWVKILGISNQLEYLSNSDKLLYLVSGCDANLVPITESWLEDINNVFKQRSKQLMTKQ